jgi:hypothetical protein
VDKGLVDDYIKALYQGSGFAAIHNNLADARQAFVLEVLHEFAVETQSHLPTTGAPVGGLNTPTGVPMTPAKLVDFAEGLVYVPSPGHLMHTMKDAVATKETLHLCELLLQVWRCGSTKHNPPTNRGQTGPQSLRWIRVASVELSVQLLRSPHPGRLTFFFSLRLVAGWRSGHCLEVGPYFRGGQAHQGRWAPTLHGGVWSHGRA